MLLEILNCSGYTIELILWLLGAFILGYLLRWFLGAKHRDRIPILEKDLATYKGKVNDLEVALNSAKYDRDKTAEDLTACKRARADVEMQLRVCKEQMEQSSSSSANLAATAPIQPNIKKAFSGGGGESSGYAAFLHPDNLQVVEGIGPKIEGLLKGDNIDTWATLAATPVSKISGILDKAGPRYRIHDPKTWPEQAKLAHEGKWDALIEHQKFLGGGTENANIMSGSSKVEKLYLKAMGLKAFEASDLKVVEGIGPKIEELLKAAGIDSHTALAGSSVDKIKEVLTAAGDRYRLADPSTWSKQAQMAVEGKWQELKEYQDFLQGGKE